jgi:PiT family inorganic phosphate transporter
MAIAWVVTLPAAAVVGAVAAWAVSDGGTLGTVVVAVVGVGVAAGIYAASRRKPVNANNVNEVPSVPEPVAAGA